MAGSEEGHVCFSVSKDCLADVTADGGGQERRTGACAKVASPAHLDGEPPLSGRLHRVPFWKAAFFKIKTFPCLLACGQSFSAEASVCGSAERNTCSGGADGALSGAHELRRSTLLCADIGVRRRSGKLVFSPLGARRRELGCGIKTPQHHNHFTPQCDTDAAGLASQSQTGDARVIRWEDRSSPRKQRDFDVTQDPWDGLQPRHAVSTSLICDDFPVRHCVLRQRVVR